jgi:heme-degrading monooxygenase HmoA
MHAVVVNVTINDEEGSVAALREQVVPRVSQAPGFVAGYWTRKGNGGLSMSVWESEDAANTNSEMVRSMAPEGVTIDSVEVREVVASA